MVAYYQHDIASWMDGTESLSDGAYRLYHVICQLIYLHGGPITYNPHGLAARCNQRPELVTRYYAPQLLKAGKIRIENGKVLNARCQSELSRIEDRRAARKSGPASARSPSATGPLATRPMPATGPLASKSLKNKEPDQQTILDSIDKKDRTEAIASAAAAAVPVFTDSTHELWHEGTAILCQLGLPDKSARSNIGRWLRDSGGDATKVLGAIQRARDARTREPIPFVTGALKTNSKPRGRSGFLDLALEINENEHDDHRQPRFVGPGG